MDDQGSLYSCKQKALLEEIMVFLEELRIPFVVITGAVSGDK